MAGKISGLGKSLDQLLDDNTPTARRSTVVLRNETGRIHVTPAPQTDTAPKKLFEEKPRNRSVKANFK